LKSWDKYIECPEKRQIQAAAATARKRLDLRQLTAMSISPYVWFMLALLLLVLIQKWIHKHVHGIAYLLTGHEDAALLVYALPLLPGVALHEVAHALMATLLGVKSANLSIIPTRQPDGHVRLGSVQVERVDVIRGSLIGLAPLLFGSAAVLLISVLQFNVSSLGDAVRSDNVGAVIASLGNVLNAPDAWVGLYFLFAIANAMVPSPADRETWPPVILFGVVMAVAAVLFGWNSAIEGVGAIIGDMLRWLAAAFTITLMVDLPFVGLIWLTEQTVGRIKGVRVAYTTNPQPDRSSRTKKRQSS
jgi:hypothetical protein